MRPKFEKQNVPPILKTKMRPRPGETKILQRRVYAKANIICNQVSWYGIVAQWDSL